MREGIGRVISFKLLIRENLFEEVTVQPKPEK